MDDSGDSRVRWSRRWRGRRSTSRTYRPPKLFHLAFELAHAARRLVRKVLAVRPVPQPALPDPYLPSGIIPNGEAVLSPPGVFTCRLLVAAQPPGDGPPANPSAIPHISYAGFHCCDARFQLREVRRFGNDLRRTQGASSPGMRHGDTGPSRNSGRTGEVELASRRGGARCGGGTSPRSTSTSRMALLARRRTTLASCSVAGRAEACRGRRRSSASFMASGSIAGTMLRFCR
jgi:hypothetical protein